MIVHMSASALAGLRALAANASARSAATAAALPPSQCLARPRRPLCSAGGMVAAVATDMPQTVTTSRPSTRDPNSPAHAVVSMERQLVKTIRKLLEAGRAEVASHLLQEEWAATSACLEDVGLSKELLLQLISSANTEAALQVLPILQSSADMCAAAIRALAEKRSLRGVRALLQHARETGVASGPDGPKVWRAAIVALGKLGRPKEARQAFVEMRTAGCWDVTDTATVNLLLNALAGDIHVQFIRCNQLRQEGVKPDPSTFNCLLKGCMRARDVKRAELALTWMRQDGCEPNEITWNTLIKVYSYSGNFDGVLRLWQQMGAAGFAPTAKLWGSLLMACSAAGQMEQAAIFWWEMKQLHSQGSGGVLTTDNVCGMMTACNDAGQYERALKAFEDAKALGIPMDTRAYNIALRACHTPGKTMRHEQLMQAFTIYDELKRSGLRPDTFTFGTLFSLCAAARQGHCALQLYGEMRELRVQENVVAMTALLKALGSTAGLADECQRIFRRMQHGPARVKPNQATYRTVIAALREQGELAAALRLYQAMRRVHPADNSEFEGLTAVAAERALHAEDADLRRVVAAVCNITSPREIDLHGMSVLEARAAVLCVFAMLQQQFRDVGSIAHDVVIITGRGLGSQGGEPVVRHEVARLLEALLAELPPETMSANAGRIVLPRRLICEALARKTAHKAQHSLPPPQSPLHLRPQPRQQQQQQQLHNQQQQDPR